MVCPTSTFTWTKVTGATYYRVDLWDDSDGEPIYFYIGGNAWNTDMRSVTFPTGILKKGYHYRIRIQARDNDQDLDARSQNNWTAFTVAN